MESARKDRKKGRLVFFSHSFLSQGTDFLALVVGASRRKNDGIVGGPFPVVHMAKDSHEAIISAFESIRILIVIEKNRSIGSRTRTESLYQIYTSEIAGGELAFLLLKTSSQDLKEDKGRVELFSLPSSAAATTVGSDPKTLLTRGSSYRSGPGKKLDPRPTSSCPPRRQSFGIL